MKNMKLSGIFKSSNVKRIMALLMAIMMVMLVGCSSDGDKKPGTQDQSNVSSEPVSDGTENVSSDETTSSVSPYDGVITADSDIKNATGRSDANEIEPTKDPAPNFKGLKGYAQKERDARLEEILNTPNTENFYKLKGRIYYVSTKGSDSNDGLSKKTPVQSLAAVDSLLLEPGDAVLFERGCIWRMLEKFECKEGVTYGSYGTGRKPMILGSPKNFAQEIWKPSKKKNVWQMSYMYAYPAGAFLDEGKEIGYQKLTMRELEKNTDYFLDEETATLYFYCDKGNPSKIYKSMEFSQGPLCMHISTGVDNVTIDNLALRYLGSGGVSTLYNNKNIDVTNCEVGYTGGVWMGDVRGGNGLGSWCGGYDYQWDHNWVYQTFDSGMSPQGNVSNHNYDNISMCNNLFEYNNCDIESWESGYRKAENANKPMTTYSNNHYDNNICRFTSLGWGTRIDDGGIRGIDGVHYGHFGKDQIKSMTFNNNIIDCPGRMIYKMTIENKGCYDNWERKGNVYYIKQSLRTLNSLTFNFHWRSETERVSGHSATDKKSTLAAFAEFEPDAKVYWYK